MSTMNIYQYPPRELLPSLAMDGRSQAGGFRPMQAGRFPFSMPDREGLHAEGRTENRHSGSHGKR